MQTRTRLTPTHLEIFCSSCDRNIYKKGTFLLKLKLFLIFWNKPHEILKLLQFFQKIGCWVVYIAKIMSFWNLLFWNVDLRTASPLRNVLIIRIIWCFHWIHHWCKQIWLTTFPFFLPKKRNENSKKFLDLGQTSISLLPKFSLADY